MSEPTPDSLDPLEIALDADRGQADSPARTLLLRHTELAEADLRHRNLQIAAERAGLVFKGLGAVAGLAVAGLIGLVLWDAAHADGLVIEAFSTPPNFAERGLTGQVLATELLDTLANMDARAVSLRRSESYSSSWSSDAKVEIPSTGVSVGELQRFLRSWLGHQTRISGEVVRIAPGKDGQPRLAVTVRAGSQPGERVEGAEADIDALLVQAAEKLYRRTQPYRYFVYSRNAGKLAEAEAALRELTRAEDLRDRVWAWSGLSNLLYGRMELPGGAEAARRALALDPGFAPALGNLANIAATASQPEIALPNARRSAARFVADQNLDPNAAKFNGLFQQITVAKLTGDFPAAARVTEQLIDIDLAQGAQRGSPLIANNSNELGLYLAQAHQPLAAERLISVPTDNDNGNFVLAWLSDRIERQDWAGAAKVEALLPVLCKDAAPYCDRMVRPALAYAIARGGDLARAQSMAAALPADCYDCAVARGRIAALAGRHAEAERHFADAARQAPSIPFAYHRWAEALLARGDADAAIGKLKMAVIKGPRYADAYELWGEALLAKGDAAGAAAKFRHASPLTPLWGRNRLMWGQALARQGKQAEARDQWIRARGLDLVPADRTRLEALLGGTRP